MSTQPVTISAEVVPVAPVELERPAAEQNQIITAVRPANNLLDKSCLISISRKWPKFSMKVPAEQIKVAEQLVAAAPEGRKEVHPSRLHSSKDLYDSQQLKDLWNYDNQIDSFIQRRTLPFKALKKGIYLLPLDLFSEVEQRLSEHSTGRTAYIENAVNAFDQSVEYAKTMLGPLFNQDDYPTKEEFAASFEFSWQYLEIGVSEALQAINADIARREGDKIRQQWIEAGEAAQALLRASMHDFVNHLVEQLQPGPEGRKKRFYDSTLGNLREFMETFDARNIVEDSELKMLVDRAKLLTQNISPDAIRNDDSVRNTIQQGFTEIKAELDKMITETPNRVVRLED